MRTTAATCRSVGHSARIFPFSFKFVILAISLVLDVTPPVSAQPSPAERATDEVLALRVQAALASDPLLKPHQLNLLVNILDGFAVVGGEVPDLKLNTRIEQISRSVFGIRGVRSSCWESPRAKDPFTRRVQEELRDLPKPQLPTMAPAPKPEQALVPASSTNADGLPPLTILSKPVDEQDRKQTPIVIPRAPAPPLLMEPIISTSPAIPARSAQPTHAPGAAGLPYPTIPPPNVPTKPVINVDDNTDWKPVSKPVDWQLIRDCNPRYANLRVIRTDRQLTIYGKVEKVTDAWDFADLLRELPNTDTVVVGRITTR